MAIYKMQVENGLSAITPLSRKTFAEIDLREREHLQAALVPHIQAISPDTLIVSEEFRLATWKDSNLRIDLLGIDKNADIVVIELKRTEEAGYAELQAIRYAALVATLTFEKVVDIYRDFLKQADEDKAAQYLINTDGNEADPEQEILGFLGWEEPNEDEFAQNTRIVLASADFSQELTTSVMWLNDSGLDIRCVRMQPYLDGENILLDIQTIIPLPEASDYQVALKEKRRSEQSARNSKRNYTKHDLTIQGQHFNNLGARDIVRTLIKFSSRSEGITPEALGNIISHKCFVGEELERSQIEEKIGPSRSSRYYLQEDEILYENGNTYVFSNQWPTVHAVERAHAFKEQFPSLEVEIVQST